ncbi:MAG: hypothetical protein SFY96_09880 [Planctomycetota bacterium]|nr:hypothetical protein [Planctomycetota bacterium]
MNRSAASCLALLVSAGGAMAQEAMYTAAATMPAPGLFVLRQQAHLFSYGTRPNTTNTRTDVYESMTSLAYGVVRDVSLNLDVPTAIKVKHIAGQDSDHDQGIEDLDLMLKWRFYKDDSGGVDTVRAALIGGAKVASGDDDGFSSQTVSPMLGGVITVVRGRHGFNQDLFYILTTGGDEADNLGGEGLADALRHNTAYLYRLAPDRYAADSVAAWYATIELNGIYETNGDYELRWSPGLMYEGRRWGAEIMAQFPLSHSLDHRPELDFALGFGVRFLF